MVLPRAACATVKTPPNVDVGRTVAAAGDGDVRAGDAGAHEARRPNAMIGHSFERGIQPIYQGVPASTWGDAGREISVPVVTDPRRSDR
jgi:hypothetical protein